MKDEYKYEANYCINYAILSKTGAADCVSFHDTLWTEAVNDYITSGNNT